MTDLVDVEERDRIVRLADGRALAYAEWGAPDGFPVFGFHGSPGSRRTHLGEEAPRSADVRLTLPDRPGFGLSDPQPGRALLDWPRDVAALADHLGVDRFAVYGFSGGGPYALACAWAMPERVTAAAVVGGEGPVRDVPVIWELEPDRGPYPGPGERTADDLEASLRESAVPFFQSLASDPEAWLDVDEAPPEHRRITDDPRWRPGFVAVGRELAANGLEALLTEWRILELQPWGFRVDDLTVPITIWHGAKDPVVPVAVARYLADTTPGATLHVLEQEAHLLLWSHADTILRELVPPPGGRAAARLTIENADERT